MLMHEYEQALTAVTHEPSSVRHKHKAALCLARMGALEHAEAAYRDFGLHNIADNEDVLALRARLLKDQAHLLSGDAKKQKYYQAAQAYLYAHKLTGGSFSAINAASLFMLAGDITQSKCIARDYLTITPTHTNLSPDITNKAALTYFHHATLAEAHLLCGDRAAAEAQMRNAIATDPRNWLNHAITLRQLKLINNHHGFSEAWLDPLRPPATCHFAGAIHALAGAGSLSADVGWQNIFNPTMDQWRGCNEPDKNAPILSAGNIFGIGEAYGALAAGADILLAEYFLENDIDLHVILPCPPDKFSAIAVSPFGKIWEGRFNACLEAAASLTLATQDRDLSCRAAIDLASIIAMGKAMERADLFATRARQITLSADAEPGAMTSTHVMAWKNAGYESTHLQLTAQSYSQSHHQPLKDQDRRLAAMLFLDVSGFGGLNDRQVIAFLEQVMVALTKCIDAGDEGPIHRASWGDGIFLVYQNPVAAAQMALRLQEVFSALDLGALDLPETLQLRVGGHYGPVTMHVDPVTDMPSVYGSQVSYAARIEPDTLPGSVFISENFAAALRVYAADEFRTYYTGKRVLRKNTPPIRLFNLALSIRADSQKV